MKKVMIIGAGAQGNVISGVLARADDVDTLLLGDVDLERANEVAQFVGSDKIKAERVDASDVAAMVNQISIIICITSRPDHTNSSMLPNMIQREIFQIV